MSVFVLTKKIRHNAIATIKLRVDKITAPTDPTTASVDFWNISASDGYVVNNKDFRPCNMCIFSFHSQKNQAISEYLRWYNMTVPWTDNYREFQEIRLYFFLCHHRSNQYLNRQDSFLWTPRLLLRMEKNSKICHRLFRGGLFSYTKPKNQYRLRLQLNYLRIQDKRSLLFRPLEFRNSICFLLVCRQECPACWVKKECRDNKSDYCQSDC